MLMTEVTYEEMVDNLCGEQKGGNGATPNNDKLESIGIGLLAPAKSCSALQDIVDVYLKLALFLKQ